MKCRVVVCHLWYWHLKFAVGSTAGFLLFFRNKSSDTAVRWYCMSSFSQTTEALAAWRMHDRYPTIYFTECVTDGLVQTRPWNLVGYLMLWTRQIQYLSQQLTTNVTTFYEQSFVTQSWPNPKVMWIKHVWVLSKCLARRIPAVLTGTSLYVKLRYVGPSKSRDMNMLSILSSNSYINT